MRYEKELQNVLQKAVFPAKKTKLIEIAQSLDAPHEVIKALEKISDKEYQSPNEVLQEFKGLKGLEHFLGM